GGAGGRAAAARRGRYEALAGVPTCPSRSVRSQATQSVSHKEEPEALADDDRGVVQRAAESRDDPGEKSRVRGAPPGEREVSLALVGGEGRVHGAERHQPDVRGLDERDWGAVAEGDDAQVAGL